MQSRRSKLIAHLLLVLSLVSATSDAADIYAIANLTGNQYQFGSIDLANPDTTGGSGNYQYAWTSIGSVSSAALQNLAYDPTTSQLYVTSEFYEFRTIDTSGSLGPILGYLLNTQYGMAFDDSGTFLGLSDNLAEGIDPLDASTMSSNPLTFDVYSQFSGFLAYDSSAGYLLANYGLTPDLLSVDVLGNLQTIGTFSGSGFDDNDWMTLFASGGSVYMLNGDRLFLVNTSNAALTRLGTISNLPAGFAFGFAGAVAVPEPATSALAICGVIASILAARKRTRT